MPRITKELALSIAAEPACKSDLTVVDLPYPKDATEFLDMLRSMHPTWQLSFFELWQQHLDNHTYWRCLGELIEDSEKLSDARRRVQELLAGRTLEGRRDLSFRGSMMTAEDQEAFVELPETVTIYRGYNYESGDRGLTWTLDRDVAEWFAGRFRDYGLPNMWIATATVRKTRFLAYLTRRDEQTAVLRLSRKDYRVERLTEVPGAERRAEKIAASNAL